MTTTVLVTSAGSIPGIAVINALQQQREVPVRIVAVDMAPDSAGFHLAAAHAVVPGAGDPALVPALLALCRREGVSVLFPIIDEELPVFAAQQGAFAAAGVRVITNTPDVVELARDKYATYQHCRAHGITVPATWLPEELATAQLPPFPLIVKPRTGRGTANVFLARSRRELEFFVEYVPSPIVQQYIPGEEYTLDLLTNLQGEIVSVVPKIRLQTKAGMQVKGRTVNDPSLIRYGAELAARLRLAPRANVQCKRAEGALHLIEINPKFPASLPLTVAAGVNAPLLLVQMCLGATVPPMLGQFQDGLLMLRYWQEVFVSTRPGAR